MGTQAYGSVAETTGLKSKDVKAVVEGIVTMGADQLKKNGSFKLAGALNLKLKKSPPDQLARALTPSRKSHASSRRSQPARQCGLSPWRSSRRCSTETARRRALVSGLRWADPSN